MSIEAGFIGLLVCGLVWAIATWRDKKRHLGQVPIIPHIYWKFFALIAALVIAANLFSAITGIVWESPFRR
jgi:hypothetical protein